jgi:DNA-binding NarL/FixJ family response regulator
VRLVIVEGHDLVRRGLAALLERLPGVQVLVWTSSLAPGEAESFLHAGAVAVLLKGGDLPGLLSSIEAAIEPHHRLAMPLE